MWLVRFLGNNTSDWAFTCLVASIKTVEEHYIFTLSNFARHMLSCLRIIEILLYDYNTATISIEINTTVQLLKRQVCVCVCSNVSPGHTKVRTLIRSTSLTPFHFASQSSLPRSAVTDDEPTACSLRWAVRLVGCSDKRYLLIFLRSVTSRRQNAMMIPSKSWPFPVSKAYYIYTCQIYQV